MSPTATFCKLAYGNYDVVDVVYSRKVNVDKS